MITENKTLRWLESQGRKMEEIHDSADTGLCNRLQHWQAAQLINEHNDNSYTIYLNEEYWPEIRELISLPYTKFIKADDIDNLHDNENILRENSKGISADDVRTLINNNFVLTENHLHSNFKIDDIHTITKFINNTDPSVIRLQDLELEYKIKTLVSDMVGIHIRRGRGIVYNSKLNTLPEDIRDLYKEYRLTEGELTEKHYIYEFVTDEVYFNIIDSIIEVNPNQKFYISHDLPDNIFKYYLDKYPNLIYTKEYFYEFIKNRYITPKRHVTNVIDLFSLSHTKFLLMHPLSSWSNFAQKYKKKIARTSTDTIDEILETYIERVSK